MGRLSSLTLLASVPAALLVVAVACDEGGSAVAPATRSEQVIATGPQPTATAPAPSATSHPPAPARARRLCDGDANARGRALPKATLQLVEAPGAAPIDPTLPARGRWTWVNFWAAWCGPCKEEMPRLLGWQDRLARAGAPVHFAFVSLDDDERQLQDFLQRQPPDGLRSTLWLPDGAKRSALLAGLRMKSAPELPEQALVDPSGHVRCFIEGAVEDGDYAEIAAIVAQ
jgi:thiol-disulfide isomerase/thioredoxin